MTQDEIIEMATQAYGECVWHESALLRLEAFVKLVAAKEREACAEICQQQSQLQLDERVMRGIDVCRDAIRARKNT